MNLRDAIKAQTIEHFKLPKGAEVSKELMAKYMMNVEVDVFAKAVLSDSICHQCKHDIDQDHCNGNNSDAKWGHFNNVLSCGGFQS